MIEKLTAVAFAAVAGVTLLGSATAGTDACGPVTTGGVTVRTWCGPAKATVTWGGRTVTIRGGECSVTSAPGLKLFAVNVGRYTVPRAKPKSTSFSASGSDLKPGTYGGWVASFQTPGRQWTLRPSRTKVTITAPGAKKGTFSGSLYEGGTAKGSWSC